MGYGDWVIASGLAKEPASRGKRVAFGDGRKILHDHNAEPILRNSPHIVWPNESLLSADIEFIVYHKGNRWYNRQETGRWIWNHDFKIQPGEFFFSAADRDVVERIGLPRRFIVIEPNMVKIARAPYLVNKKWPFQRFVEVADRIRADGHQIVQFIHQNAKALPGVWHVQTPSFRSAASILQRASLLITHEGGMHHAAAAVGVPAVVLFGSWIPPTVLGYDTHINLTGGATQFCGSLEVCAHCAAAMDRITVDEVVDAAYRQLRVGK